MRFAFHAVLPRCLVLLVSSGTLTWCGCQPQSEDGSLANSFPEPPLVDDTDLDHAIAQLIEEALAGVRKEPKSAAAWGHLGKVYLAHEFEGPAVKCFKVASSLDSAEARWPYFHARSIIRTQPEDAAVLLEQAATLCNDNPEAPRLRLIEVLVELHRLDDAESQLFQFLDEHPDNNRAHLAKARLRFIQGNAAACVKALEQCSNMKHAAKTATLLQAEAYRRLGKADDADSLRARAEQMSDRDWPDSYMNEVFSLQTGVKAQLVRADLMFGRGDVVGSIELLEEIAQEYPKSEWARILLGRALIKERRLDRAVETLEGALKINPNAVEAQFRLGVALYHLGRYEEAADWYRKAVAVKPDFTMAYYNLGYCLEQLQDMEGAISAFRKACRCEPDHFHAHAVLGDRLATKGDNAEARKYLQRAVELKPDNGWARKRLQQISASDWIDTLE